MRTSRTTVTPHRSLGVALASLASIAALASAACQGPAAPGGSGGPTSTPTATAGSDPSQDPTGDPTPDPTPDPAPDPTVPTDPGDIVAVHDFSDPVFSQCGEAFELPARPSELTVEEGPTEPMPEAGGGWSARVTNSSMRLVQGWISPQTLVLVDETGRVVATPDPEDEAFLGAEGPSWMGVAAGATLDVGVRMPADCETGEWLPEGDYQAYATISFVGIDGYEQAQGGPWPVTIGGGDDDSASTVPDGTVAVDLSCGADWGDPRPSTGYEIDLIDPIRTDRSATDDIDGRAVISVAAPIDAIAFTEVIMLSEGRVVNHMPGSDRATTLSATESTSMPAGFGNDLLDCASSTSDPRPLDPGVYQVVVGALTMTADGAQLLAVTDPVDVRLR